MPLARRRQWRAQNQQRALTEFGLARQALPQSIYLAVTPNDFAAWNGILFVRKGPYSSAILKFWISLPDRYPDGAPLVVFSTDVFHPLVTPLTTYTYTTGSSATDPVSATDEERLPPGGLSMSYHFPRWFEHARSPSSPMFRNGVLLPNGTNRSKRSSWDSSSPRGALKGHSRKSQSFHIPPPREDDDSTTPSEPSHNIVEVLRYIKRAFEDEKCLDNLPLEAAGNPGAWHAWRSYRKRHLTKTDLDTNTPTKVGNTVAEKRGRGWNWDGIWADRAKKAILASQSDATLFGDIESEELLHFLDIDEELLKSHKSKILEMDGK